jgi:hypothetical protein
MSGCSRHHSQYFYHASAHGLSAEIERPTRHSIPTQAATVLGPNGGRGYQRVENFSFDGIISFKAAFAEVGGSFDECHNRHTSYAGAVIEDLNILDVIHADRIVSRMAIYSPIYPSREERAAGKKPKGNPDEGDETGEHSFDITGSHFQNLRVAGHLINVKLATHVFRKHNTYSKIANAHKDGALADWILGSKFKKNDLPRLEDNYHAIGGMSESVQGWMRKENRPAGGSYIFSPANDFKLSDHIRGETELECFGSFIFVPKFGVVRLPELRVTPHCRTLTMLQFYMCSTGTGGGGLGGTHGSGGTGGGG